MRTYYFIKQTADTLFALLSLLCLWPFFILIAFAVKMGSKGPVFFRQKRICKNRREFYILKFRTMRTGTPKDMPTHLLQNPEAFITGTGKFLRKTSLDELPQIINVLKGEMSFIGPRPALWNQCDLLTERDKYGVNEIKPGLTGWAQINGRDELPDEVKAKYDGEYKRNMSAWLDIKIFFLTIARVIKSDGVVEGAPNSSSKTKGAAS